MTGPVGPRTRDSPAVPRTARAAAALTLAVVLAACSSDGRTLAPAGPDQTQSIMPVTSVTLPATETTNGVVTTPEGFQVLAPWIDGGAIDPRFTCDGENVSPPISWARIPPGTEELAVTITDLDASGYVHWVVTGLPADEITFIEEGATPEVATEAMNDAGTPGYSGPCPPAGETHRYLLRVVALSGPADVTPGMPGRQALARLDAKTLAVAGVTGTFKRTSG